jgi:magnesium chelatase family protein
LAAQPITIEVHLAGGLPGVTIVGMADLAVREAKDRVKSAIQYSGFEFPARGITVNLAPSDLPKDGAHFDLSISVGNLAAIGQVDANAISSGEVPSVRGSLPAALHIAETGRELILPAANGAETALASQCLIAAASHLNEVVAHINKLQTLPRPEAQIQSSSSTLLDIADVRGQQQAKRAVFVAAAGRHSKQIIPPSILTTLMTCLLVMDLVALRLQIHRSQSLAFLQKQKRSGARVLGPSLQEGNSMPHPKNTIQTPHTVATKPQGASRLPQMCI